MRAVLRAPQLRLSNLALVAPRMASRTWVSPNPWMEDFQLKGILVGMLYRSSRGPRRLQVLSPRHRDALLHRGLQRARLWHLIHQSTFKQCERVATAAHDRPLWPQAGQEAHHTCTSTHAAVFDSPTKCVMVKPNPCSPYVQLFHIAL